MLGTSANLDVVLRGGSGDDIFHLGGHPLPAGADVPTSLQSQDAFLVQDAPWIDYTYAQTPFNPAPFPTNASSADAAIAAARATLKAELEILIQQISPHPNTQILTGSPRMDPPSDTRLRARLDDQAGRQLGGLQDAVNRAPLVAEPLVGDDDWLVISGPVEFEYRYGDWQAAATHAATPAAVSFDPPLFAFQADAVYDLAAIKSRVTVIGDETFESDRDGNGFDGDELIIHNQGAGASNAAFDSRPEDQLLAPTLLSSSNLDVFDTATAEKLTDGSGLSDPLDDVDKLADALSVTHVIDGDFRDSWTTNTVGAGVDYYAGRAADAFPTFVWDLGQDQDLANLLLWQRQNNGQGTGDVGNNTQTFELRFSSEADGAVFSAKADFSGVLASTVALGGVNPAQRFALNDLAAAQGVRYVQMTVSDNYFGQPGITGGGDRVGLGEIRFDVEKPNTDPVYGLSGLTGLGGGLDNAASWFGIEYEQLERIELRLGDDADAVTVDAAPAGTDLKLILGGGNDDVTLNQLNADAEILGGAGDDTLTANGTVAGQTARGTVLSFDGDAHLRETLVQEVLSTDSEKLAAQRDLHDSARAVGGDMYDCFALPDGKICLSFGDVAGKGVPGALIMSRMASCVQSTIRHVHDVVEAICAINDHMCDSDVEGRFVTYVLIIVDTQNHQVMLSNAGHLPPIIRRANGVIEQFSGELAGPPICVVDGYPYELETCELRPGDLIVLMTDGVDEAMNPEGEVYGVHRALDFVREGPADAEQLGKRLLEDVRRHARGCLQSDDITIMTFGRSATD